MKENTRFSAPSPIVNSKEIASLDDLTKCYNKLIQPSKIAILGQKVGSLVPEGMKEFGAGITKNITAQELYQQSMELIAKSFKVVEEKAAKYSISEKTILKKANEIIPNYKITEIDEICFARSYKLSKIVNSYKMQDSMAAFIEGGVTGAIGFWGLPFNFVLSTFLYFRAVQVIAMIYGYDVRNDIAEMVIASEVFANALSPTKNDINNEMTSIIGKVMVMTQASVVKQTAKKTWTDMASRGGIPLLLTQMRALAHKAAQKALQNAGAKGLENSIFKEVFEQVGRKLTLKTIQKSVPAVSAVLGAIIDTAQMDNVLKYADIFYQKRFILEKEKRIMTIVESKNAIIEADSVEL